jgi:hypothetical protein
MVLKEIEGDDLLDVPERGEVSNVAALLELGKGCLSKDSDESSLTLELVLDLLQNSIVNHFTLTQLASALPRLVTVSRVRGSKRVLHIPHAYSRIIVQALLACSTDVINGRSCSKAAFDLAQPYLSHFDADDSLRRAFSPSLSSPIAPPLPDTTDGRRLTRLAEALASSHSTSILHQATPAELVSLIAPSYFRTLSSAPLPPLGIPSSIPDYTPESQASAWAGKVYSEHEFRTRENVGLGIAGVAARVSRPASRHVDEY